MAEPGWIKPGAGDLAATLPTWGSHLHDMTNKGETFAAEVQSVAQPMSDYDPNGELVSARKCCGRAGPPHQRRFGSRSALLRLWITCIRER